MSRCSSSWKNNPASTVSFHRRLALGFVVLCLQATAILAQSVPGLVQLNSAQLWQRLEFQITNVPAATNPFDPDLIRLDATFNLPSGRSLTVPAFWFQGYQRFLSSNTEFDAPLGAPGWRLRFTPPETGSYSLSLQIFTNGQPYLTPFITTFNVPATTPPLRFGYVGIAAGNRYFQTSDGQGLPLKGQNIGWPSSRGTFDYDTWLASAQAAGENFARVWMWPTSFGIEVAATNLDNYALAPAWQLDYVLQLAEQRGIYLQLALDYHGMFATQPDYWGGNNYWPQNPYNLANGGPCSIANDFFTNVTAQHIYQKRLRYLIGRYGYSQNLLGWEFFNEIDNDYTFLNSTNVAAWHATMGAWMRTNDPFGHLRTTSLTSAGGHPEIWSLPQLDYFSQHSYNEANPGTSLSADTQQFFKTYGKPVMVGEFGTSWQGWNRSNDPYLRGFRQGLWGGSLGGSVGTAMSWWWENIAAENDYPVYSALNSILSHSGWGNGAWTNITFQTSGSPPTTVGTVTGNQPFDVLLPLDGNWGDLVLGRFALPYPQVAGNSAGALESFVHGSSHSSLRTPFKLSAWFTNNASIIMHLNSVSFGAVMAVYVDGVQTFSTNLPNLDGGTTVSEEYNIDVPVSIPAGKHTIDVYNPGTDWYYLDYVRLTQVLPATYLNNWQPSPASIGLAGPHESLLYVVAPWVSFPASATNSSLPLQHSQTLVLSQWPAGDFIAEWYNPPTATLLGHTQSTTTNGVLTLPLPDYTEDVAGIVYPPPSINYPLGSLNVGFQFQLQSRTGGQCVIQESTDLATWSLYLSVTNTTGTMVLPGLIGTNSHLFLRAVENP